MNKRVDVIAGSIVVLLMFLGMAEAQVLDVAGDIGGRSLHASAAPHPDGYWIVVWGHHRFPTERFTSYSRKITSTAVGRSFPISNPGVGFQPDIVYNSRLNEFMVSWNTPTFAGASPIKSRIEVQRLDTSGFDKLGIRAISQRNFIDSASKIAYSPDHNTFMVTWQRSSPTHSFLPLGYAGFVQIGKPPLLHAIAFGGDDTSALVSDVVYNSSAIRFFAAVETYSTGAWNLYLVPVNPGNCISETPILIGKRTSQVNGFSLASSRQNSYTIAVWIEAGKLFGRILGGDGRPIGPLRVLQPSGVVANQAVTATSTGYTISYCIQKNGAYELWALQIGFDGRIVSRRKISSSQNYLLNHFLSFNPATGRTLAGWGEIVDEFSSIRLLATSIN